MKLKIRNVLKSIKSIKINRNMINGFCFRQLFAAGMFLVAFGFILPFAVLPGILGSYSGSYNGFRIASILGDFKKAAGPAFDLVFVAALVGTVCVFFVKNFWTDICSFGFIIIDFIFIVLQFVSLGGGKSSHHSSGSSFHLFGGITNSIVHSIESEVISMTRPGLYLFILGIVIALAGLILTFVHKEYKK